ncbi:MAG: hypothetical protein GXP04_05965 [Alphaproteobacteria bacterium]|nr:hypothetical protein [Alphaproteobacteria bacterium]
MNSSAPISKYLRRALSSLVAIAAVSVIFGAKAFESQQAASASAPPTMTVSVVK